ncbi:i-AAA protease yme1 [Brettanomyces nanus]|uniref:I-AAA protease yme1 n=1 Tax=Eeniella nana TaxID=13502 RepID=A0A875RQF1_EENNA|nr:i-AAA protease yme1 [Brettanomyces nanus]QPG76750.1 i-AAA protease yme1 [Brettanomyces nanus]
MGLLSVRRCLPMSRAFLIPYSAALVRQRINGLSLRSHRSIRHYSATRSVYASAMTHQSTSSIGPNRALADQEQKANRELSSPAAQADFYRSLLRANYPHIVVSRYETPGISINNECAQLYVEALLKMGNRQKADRIARTYGIIPSITYSSANGVGSSINESPMSNGASAGSAGSGNPWGPGSKEAPIHVVVSESIAVTFSKWIKWIIPIGLLTYGAYIAFNFLVENGSIIKSATVDDKSVEVSESDVKFSDCCGVDEAKAELEEVVEFLKDPSKFTSLGAQLPKGVLLTGPPGTGKTLLARATAGEAGVPFFFMSGSEFDEMYVGVGAKRVRELFNKARARAPSIIFIDELDAVGGKRKSRDQAYAKQTLNQLLVELDGFSQTEGVVIIGATNFPDSLDKALTRPGRFDKIVTVDLPDVRGRTEILKHHLKNIACSKEVDPSVIARGTTGLSGAALKNLVNTAALYASHENALSVNMNHLEWAKDKVLMGGERKTMVMTEETRRNTAYHEAGHAIAAMFTEGATPLYKATILPRGRALGITFQLPEMDKLDITRRECIARLDVCMGGKIAEEMLYGPFNVTSGCSSDLSSATETARAMVTAYGMSDKIGPVKLSDKWDSWSLKVRDMADEETRKLLVASEERTRKLLHEKRIELKRLAEGLLQYETLTRMEMDKIVKGELIDKAKMTSNKIIKGPSTRKEYDVTSGNKATLSVVAAEE